MARERRTQIGGQFAPRLIDMLRSPAWGVLSLTARRILDRLEIEMADHGGTENGRLPVTYSDFERYGIHRHQIAAGLAEVTALGFVEITQAGRAGNAEHRAPTLYRITYRHTKHAKPTDEWRSITTDDDAERRVRAAREEWREREKLRQQKQKASGGIRQMLVTETATENGKLPPPETVTTGSVRKPSLLSISRGGAQ